MHTQVQYLLIYVAVQEAVMSGYSNMIPTSSFKETMAELDIREQLTGKTEIQKQFEVSQGEGMRSIIVVCQHIFVVVRGIRGSVLV